VHEHAAALLEEHLRLRDHGHKCRASLLVSVLLFAASRITSLFDACRRLARAPSDEALRRALLAGLPSVAELQRRLNAALGACLPKGLKKRRYPMAIDLTLIPYHGQPYRRRCEVYRNRAKSGTTHFHAYATCYVLRKGHRFTVALTRVLHRESMVAVVERLLDQAQSQGLRPRYLLLDRGFYSAAVIQALQARRCPFVMPVVKRGRRPAGPGRRPRGIRRLETRRRSGWSEHTLRTAKGVSVRFRVCISCGNARGRGARQRRRTFLYACWGIAQPAAAWVRQVYRGRFGIETSYRQMHQARIRTSSRRPLLRLLFVGIALILRNVWVWFHLTVLARRCGPHLQLRLARLRFRTLLLWLQRCVESLLDTPEPENAKPTPHTYLLNSTAVY
jgi:putative transposase